MSFPYRTVIHDDKHDEIYYPEDIKSNRLIDPEMVPDSFDVDGYFS